MPIFNMPIPTSYGQNVKPYDGSKLYFFESGTTTPKTSYSDSTEATPQTHPVVADGSGRFPAIYLSGLYKAVLKDKNDVQIWEEDGLQGRGGEFTYLGEFDENTNGGDYPSSGTIGDTYKTTPGFTLNSGSGSHLLFTGDFIVANKAGALGIDADWDIFRGVGPGVGTVALLDDVSIQTDALLGNVFTVTLAGNRTLANPTNKIIGKTYIWEITQDATGGRTLAYGTDFVFSGSNVINSDADSVTVIQGTVISSTLVRCEIIGFKNPQAVLPYDLTIKNNTTNPTYQLDVNIPSEGISETLDITADLDTGSEASSTWYYIWRFNKNGDTVFKFSASSTAPTEPAGYIKSVIMGAVYNDSGSDFDTMYQRGNIVSITNTNVLTNGASASYTLISLAVTVPAIAKTYSAHTRIFIGSSGLNINLSPYLSGATEIEIGVDVLTQVFMPVHVPIVSSQETFYKANISTWLNLDVYSYTI